MKRYTLFVNLSMLILMSCSSTPRSPELTATPSVLGVGSTMISDKDGMTLVYVPAGEFIMGSNNGESNEKPVHTVEVDAFWIDKTEVTVRMYKLCVEASVCKELINKWSSTRLGYYGNAGFDNFPVIYVDWEMAKTFCEWVNRRLPTEAEWEKAARGTNGRTYPWGAEISCSLANYWDGYDGCINDTTEVGTYLDGASIYGALDMAGNVWEYVNDWYSETYYSNSPLSNPSGPESGRYRIVRGGSWFDGKDVVRSSFRGYVTPAGGDYSATDNQGFRCSMSATP